MKKSILIALCLSIGLVATSQEIGGCVSYLANNYNPEATYNDGTCDYDLQQLLLDGASLGDLAFSGVLESEIVGLFAAGGVVVDVDLANNRALIASAHNSELLHGETSGYNCRDFTYNLQGDELLSNQIEENLYGGKENTRNIMRSYFSRYGGYTANNSPCGNGDDVWDYPLIHLLGMVRNMGYDDWYIPNEAEFDAYLTLTLTNGSSNVSWPTDPNGGSGTATLRFPSYSFASHYKAYVTSSVTNAGVSQNMSMRIITMNDEDELSFYPQYFVGPNLLGASGSDWWISHSTLATNYSHYSPFYGNQAFTFLPMRIEILDPPATTNSCTDWQYGDAGNQSITAGVPCLYPLFQCDSVESAIWDELVIGAYPANTTVVEYGRDDTRDVLINIPSTHEIDDNIYDVVHYEVTGISDVPVGLDVNLSVGDSIAGGDVHCLDFSGTALSEGVYTVTIDGILRMDILGSVLQVDITMTHVIAVIPNVTGIEGCVYTSADNYDPLATVDNGTCTFGGLCPGDFDGDDLIGVTDILYLLGIYNSTCE